MKESIQDQNQQWIYQQLLAWKKKCEIQEKIILLLNNSI